VTTSRQTRDDSGGSESGGKGNGDRKFHAQPSQDLANDDAPNGKSQRCVGDGCDRGCTGWSIASGNTGEAQDDATIAENDTSNLSGNISCGACLPFWRITCMLVSVVVVCCING